MKAFKKYIYIFLLPISLGCTDNFGELNTNPSIVTEPDINYLLTFSEDRLMTYQGSEWVWENMEHLLRYTQHFSASPYELTGNVNTRYGAFYSSILPNLLEIRRQIDNMPDAERYQNMKMITYLIEILQGIKVTDMSGAIPYTEAGLGRYEVKFDPKYDSQELLFSTWLGTLNEVIQTLSTSTNQESYGNADIYYQSDWTKWIKLANTLKLRIAVRLENQVPDRTAAIFQEVMEDPVGPIDSEAAQMVFTHDTYTPFGTGSDIGYRSTRYATSSIIDFLKETNDPRLPIYFSPNDLVGNYEEILAENNVSLPDFIDSDDPLIEFQGGPADWTTAPEVANYFSNPLIAGSSRLFLMSEANPNFFSPKVNNATGVFMDVVVSYAETCFYIAELIQKGYGAGSSGSAEDWYKRGIAASIRTMNSIAERALSTTAFDDDGEAVIMAYLEQPSIQFNGQNDLEKIFIQQYLNFLRQPNEGFVFCRRTGYPKDGSSYYPREPFNEPVPRRFWLGDPGEVNRANWLNAMEEQGFTPLSQDVNDLNTERVWYDKPAPDFGEGQ
jgi:hypothetical protein